MRGRTRGAARMTHMACDAAGAQVNLPGVWYMHTAVATAPSWTTAELSPALRHVPRKQARCTTSCHPPQQPTAPALLRVALLYASAWIKQQPCLMILRRWGHKHKSNPARGEGVLFARR